MIKKKIVIKGPKVQNVGYRLFLLDMADEFGISHLNVDNIDDIDKDKNQIVFVFVGGDKEIVDNFTEFIKENYPKNANTRNVEVVDEEYKGNIRTTESFSRSLSVSQLYKIVGSGTVLCGKMDIMIEKQDVMIKKQDVMIEKQDVMIEKQDVMIEKQDVMIEKQDVMIKRQDETIGEIRNLRDDLKVYFDKRFDKIEKDMSKIKAKIKMIS